MTITTKIELSPKQQEARAAIVKFMGSDKPYFSLHGLAGSGKTTVIADIAREFDWTRICTLTGKAASVLRRKTGLMVSTIHSEFYEYIGKEKDKRGKEQLKFVEAHEAGDLEDAIVLIDECSMVNEAMANDILRTGARIVACGDPGQLPPVSGKQFFWRPDFFLNEIHRQAQDSPIIRQAHAVRNGHPYQPDTDLFRVVRKPTDEDLLMAGTILCWTNKRRIAGNEYMRRLNGYSGYPQPGEPVICLRNVRDMGIFNGAVYTLLEQFLPGQTEILIDVDGTAVKVPMVEFHGVPTGLKHNEEALTKFDFGYVMTVHKAQGSEWDNVVLIDEYGRREDREKWLYTGITRAASRITVVSAVNHISG